MIEVSLKNTPPALAGGGELPAVAGFESARSADIVRAIEDGLRVESTDLATKQDIEALDRKIETVEGNLRHEIELVKKEIAFIEERMTRKMAQQHTATIVILGGLMAAFRFWF